MHKLLVMGLFVFIYLLIAARPMFLVYVLPLQNSDTLDKTPVTITHKPCISEQCKTPDDHYSAIIYVAATSLQDSQFSHQCC
jgi:hypothetical protein